jgi:hypothetical protein
LEWLLFIPKKLTHTTFKKSNFLSREKPPVDHLSIRGKIAGLLLSFSHFFVFLKSLSFIQIIHHMKNTFYILALILTFASCQKTKEVSKIVVANWLLGNWENKSDDGHLLENWKKVNDSLYDGESYFIKGKDTLHFEKIQMKQKGEALFYIATVKGQNNDKPITFVRNDTIEKQLVFENPKHDFPQKIMYSQITKESIVIQISGIQQGKPSSERYSMKKTE